MPSYILRNIPADLWRAAKTKAASEGKPLRALFLSWLVSYANQPAASQTDEREE